MRGTWRRAIRVCRSTCSRATTRRRRPRTTQPRSIRTAIDTRMRWLVDKVIADRWFAARVLPQLHVMLWGNKRGV